MWSETVNFYANCAEFMVNFLTSMSDQGEDLIFVYASYTCTYIHVHIYI